VINTNLPPICHRFQVTVNFLLARRECLTLTLSLRVIPANSAVILWRTFLPQEVSVYFNHFYVIRPESCRIARNYAEVTAITSFKAIQGQLLVPIEAHMRLPISD